MTEKATRGYEDVIAADPEGVAVVATAGEFRAAMATRVANPERAEPVGLQRRGQLRWVERLAPLKDVVRRSSR
jgi:hypothetical protein